MKWRLAGSDPAYLLLGYAPSLAARGIAAVARVTIHAAAAEVNYSTENQRV